ncbi:MAG: amidohydrolase family protein [Deltaproteobacteria bacterium]
MIIDVHNHFIPERTARAYGAEPGKPVTVVEKGIPKFTIRDREFNVETRLSEMKKAGISIQLLSSPVGWDASIEECRALNDQLANLQRQYKGRLMGLAALPLGVSESDKDVFQELHRAIGRLELKGVSIPAQPSGLPMDDKRFYPFYKEVEEMGVTVFVHPSATPSGFDAIAKYNLHRIVGREYELSAVICRIIYGGVIEDFPGLKLVFSHFGGGISALVERIQPRYQPQVKTDPPHDFIHFAKHLYFDTAGFRGGMLAFRLACDVLGPSRMLFGTDYPQDLEEGEEMKNYIDALRSVLKDEDYETIMHKNAMKLCGLRPRDGE